MSDVFRAEAHPSVLRALPDSLRENLEHAIDVGGTYALIRLPDQVPVEALEACVRGKGGIVERFRPLPEAEIVGGKHWDYGIIEALDQAASSQSMGLSIEEITRRLSRTYPEDRVRATLALLRGEKPFTSILVLPDPRVDADRLDGSYFSVLQMGRDNVFPVLLRNGVKLFFAVPGERGFQALNRALQLQPDLYSVRDLPVSVE